MTQLLAKFEKDAQRIYTDYDSYKLFDIAFKDARRIYAEKVGWPIRKKNKRFYKDAYYPIMKAFKFGLKAYGDVENVASDTGTYVIKVAFKPLNDTTKNTFRAPKHNDYSAALLMWMCWRTPERAKTLYNEINKSLTEGESPLVFGQLYDNGLERDESRLTFDPSENSTKWASDEALQSEPSQSSTDTTPVNTAEQLRLARKTEPEEGMEAGKKVAQRVVSRTHPSNTIDFAVSSSVEMLSNEVDLFSTDQDVQEALSSPLLDDFFDWFGSEDRTNNSSLFSKTGYDRVRSIFAEICDHLEQMMDAKVEIDPVQLEKCLDIARGRYLELKIGRSSVGVYEQLSILMYFICQLRPFAFSSKYKAKAVLISEAHYENIRTFPINESLSALLVVKVINPIHYFLGLSFGVDIGKTSSFITWKKKQFSNQDQNAKKVVTFLCKDSLSIPGLTSYLEEHFKSEFEPE